MRKIISDEMKAGLGSGRRRFLTRLLVTASYSSIVTLLTPFQVAAKAKSLDAIEKLRTNIKGAVLVRDDNEYEAHRLALVWQMLKPRRYPSVIVQVESVDEVIRTIKFASENKYQVSVRCGGHNYLATFLADGVLVLDISRLHSVDIDPLQHTARIGPGVRGVSLIHELAKHDLSFPVAHCGTVPLSGFLLGGGMGWNGEAWGGLACMNIEELEIVTANGELVKANASMNADLYWAARGAGPCFFGVVTSFTIKVYDKPASVMSSIYIWPVEYAEEICAWAEKKSRQMPEYVEPWFLLAAIPAAENGSDEYRSVCMVIARAYATDEQTAQAALEPLQTAETDLSASLIDKFEFQQTSIPSMIAELEPETAPWNYWAADNFYTDEPAAPLAEKLINHMQTMPSHKSSIVFIFRPYSQEALKTALPAYGKTFIGNYNIWTETENVQANIDWGIQTMKLIDTAAKGHYINETNYAAKSSRIEKSFNKSGWQKLSSLHEKYDSKRLFHTLLN